MRNDLVHGVRVYKLTECRKEAEYVLDALDQQGSDNIPVAHSEELESLSGSMKAFSDLIEKSEANKCLKEI